MSEGIGTRASAALGHAVIGGSPSYILIQGSGVQGFHGEALDRSLKGTARASAARASSARNELICCQLQAV